MVTAYIYKLNRLHFWHRGSIVQKQLFIHLQKASRPVSQGHTGGNCCRWGQKWPEMRKKRFRSVPACAIVESTPYLSGAHTFSMKVHGGRHKTLHRTHPTPYFTYITDAKKNKTQDLQWCGGVCSDILCYSISQSHRRCLRTHISKFVFKWLMRSESS